MQPPQGKKGIMDTLKGLWGVGAPRGFKLGAWAVAFAGFGLLHYYENLPTLTVHFKAPERSSEPKSSSN